MRVVCYMLRFVFKANYVVGVRMYVVSCVLYTMYYMLSVVRYVLAVVCCML